MHTRTRRDLVAMHPLTFAPRQRIRNADGDCFERRGGIAGVPLDELPIDERPLVLTRPDMLVQGPLTEPADPPTWAVAGAVIVLILFFIGLVVCLVATVRGW